MNERDDEVVMFGREDSRIDGWMDKWNDDEIFI